MRYSPPRYPSGGGFSFAGRMTPGVKWLLIVNVALFVIYFFGHRTDLRALFQILSLWPAAVLHVIGLPQLFTYMFLHDPTGFGHILFNMLALWMFGTTLEASWGTRPFLRYYFFCGVTSGLCTVFAHWMFGTTDVRTIGASGAIYGLLLAFGYLFPDVTILFAFLFPIKAKYFVIIIGAIAFLSSWASFRITADGTVMNDNVSHVTHLAGMAFGFLYLKFGMARWNFDVRSGLTREYQEWKRRRARRKFEVYMRKRNGKDSIH
jgi:membrane associated rhomboid family serine protease